MNLLALDTATEACSVALSMNGEIIEQYKIAPREHSHLILGMIEQVLSEASIQKTELDAIAFGRGPGSFMGLRIAAGVTQGIAYALDLPVIPVSTLAAIAQVAHEQTGQTHILAAIDARMAEVYWAAYALNETDELVLQGEEVVCPPAEVPVPQVAQSTGMWYGAGTGWQTYTDVLLQRMGGRVEDYKGECFPKASAIAHLALIEHGRGNTVSADQALPVYIRNKVAKKRAEQAR